MLTKQKIRTKILGLISRSSLLTVMYLYATGSINAHANAVIAGILSYEKNNHSTDGQPIFDFIRSIHRIEKGLIMPNRRDEFASSYILKTVKQLDQLLSINSETLREKSRLQWGIDVLGEYFSVVNSEKQSEIHDAKKLYGDILFKHNRSVGVQKPYKRSVLKDCESPSYYQLSELARQRRSTRFFLQKEVEDELLHKALDIASMSPSACNRQPYAFKIFKNREQIEAIANLSIGMSGFQSNVPCLIVVTGYFDAYFHPRDSYIPYIDASLAAMSFQYALETLGLSSTTVNWPATKDKEVQLKKMINLKSFEKVIMLIAVGYPDPDGGIAYSAKKKYSEIV